MGQNADVFEVVRTAGKFLIDRDMPELELKRNRDSLADSGGTVISIDSGSSSNHGTPPRAIATMHY